MVETGSNNASTSSLMANVKGGNDSIAIGQTQKIVAHGLTGGAPTAVSVTPIHDSTGVDIWEDETLRDATNIVIKMDFAQAATVNFSWTAIR